MEEKVLVVLDKNAKPVWNCNDFLKNRDYETKFMEKNEMGNFLKQKENSRRAIAIVTNSIEFFHEIMKEFLKELYVLILVNDEQFKSELGSRNGIKDYTPLPDLFTRTLDFSPELKKKLSVPA